MFRASQIMFRASALDLAKFSLRENKKQDQINPVVNQVQLSLFVSLLYSVPSMVCFWSSLAIDDLFWFSSGPGWKFGIRGRIPENQ